MDNFVNTPFFFFRTKVRFLLFPSRTSYFIHFSTFNEQDRTRLFLNLLLLIFMYLFHEFPVSGNEEIQHAPRDVYIRSYANLAPPYSLSRYYSNDPPPLNFLQELEAINARGEARRIITAYHEAYYRDRDLSLNPLAAKTRCPLSRASNLLDACSFSSRRGWKTSPFQPGW